MDKITESPFLGFFPMNKLSERQKQCLELVARGHTSKEIGRMLSLSPSTVDNHLSIALERLGVDSRVAAARIFIQGNEGVNLTAAGKAGTEQNENILADNGNRQIPANRHENLSRSFFSIPALGGRSNNLSLRRRYFHVIQIMLLALMAFSAATITIAGIVHLFSK